MATNNYSLDTNPGDDGNATAANQVIMIGDLGSLVDLAVNTNGAVQDILMDTNQLLGRSGASNLNTKSFTGSTLNNLLSDMNAFYAAFPNVDVLYIQTFVDGLQPGGLLPAGYSSVITYSIV
jgi:hypothetical protein